ncbi:hypothetical protein JB92DRAFT_2835994 [Gautieria morchelliformis]|nr:hypothetical protein JB92DRAFT_2835994 [Gautieria morchelliformis]
MASTLLPALELAAPSKKRLLSIHELPATAATSLDLSLTAKQLGKSTDIDMSPLRAPLIDSQGSSTAGLDIPVTPIHSTRDEVIVLSSDTDEVEPARTQHKTNCKSGDLYLGSIKAAPKSRAWNLGHTANHNGDDTEIAGIQDVPNGAPPLLSVYKSLEDARSVIYDFEESRGNKMRVGQSKRVSKSAESGLKKVTYCCSCYASHTPKHKPNIDPSDFRSGKSIRKNCLAHVNVNRILPSYQWHITAANWTHNHDAILAPGAAAPRPPAPDQRAAVRQYACAGNFTRDHLRTILAQEFPGHILEDRQISNIMNAAGAAGRAEVSRLGGDIATVIARLDSQIADGEAW